MAKKKSKKSKLCDFSRFEKDRRYFGKFLCPQCKRHWQSNNAWLNYGQMCQACNVFIEAYDMRPLRPNELIQPNPTSGDNVDDNSADEAYPHPQELCERCIELGFSCWQTDLEPPTSLKPSPSTLGQSSAVPDRDQPPSKTPVSISSLQLLGNVAKCALLCGAIVFIVKRYL